MKKEEFDILGIKKRAEGKDHYQIREELNNLNIICKETKTDKKIIEEQDKRIKKLKEKIKQQNNKIFNLEFNKTDSKVNSKEEITLSDIKKIVCLIKTEEPIKEKEIKEITNINKISTVLSFLKRNEVIKEKIIKGKKHYTI